MRHSARVRHVILQPQSQAAIVQLQVGRTATASSQLSNLRLINSRFGAAASAYGCLSHSSRNRLRTTGDWLRAARLRDDHGPTEATEVQEEEVLSASVQK